MIYSAIWLTETWNRATEYHNEIPFLPCGIHWQQHLYPEDKKTKLCIKQQWEKIVLKSLPKVDFDVLMFFPPLLHDKKTILKTKKNTIHFG